MMPFISLLVLIRMFLKVLEKTQRLSVAKSICSFENNTYCGRRGVVHGLQNASVHLPLLLRQR